MTGLCKHNVKKINFYNNQLKEKNKLFVLLLAATGQQEFFESFPRVLPAAQGQQKLLSKTFIFNAATVWKILFEYAKHFYIIFIIFLNHSCKIFGVTTLVKFGNKESNV